MYYIKMMTPNEVEYISCYKFHVRYSFQDSSVIAFVFQQEDGSSDTHYYGAIQTDNWFLEVYVMNEAGKTVDHLNLEIIKNILDKSDNYGL